MAQVLGQQPSDGAVVIQAKIMELLYLWLLWTVLVVAIARPQYLEPPVSQVVPTRDLMLLVDLSGSMEAEDFTSQQGRQVDRLTAVKEVLDEFLTRREGDRVGLIVFGNAAFTQVPFTQDLDATRILLEETTVRMAGPRTALGDAIGLAITLFEQSEVEERVIVALTDGNDTGSRVPPVEAARIANDNDIMIHMIGVGDPTSVGEEKLDEEALKSVASITGGRYFHAADREELQGIYTELDRIDTREVETATYRPRIDLFHWLLALFVILGFFYHAGILLMSAINKRRLARE
jgi:Ca-activated chloride channel family protein